MYFPAIWNMNCAENSKGSIFNFWQRESLFELVIIVPILNLYDTENKDICLYGVHVKKSNTFNMDDQAG